MLARLANNFVTSIDIGHSVIFFDVINFKNIDRRNGIGLLLNFVDL